MAMLVLSVFRFAHDSFVLTLLDKLLRSSQLLAGCLASASPCLVLGSEKVFEPANFGVQPAPQVSVLELYPMQTMHCPSPQGCKRSPCKLGGFTLQVQIPRLEEFYRIKPGSQG